MKKTLIAVLLLVGSLGLFAQANTGYFSVSPGYQFSSGDVQDGYVVGLDGGYFFNDHVGIHFGYTFNEGKFAFKYNIPPFSFEQKYDDNFGILEVGPEFVGKAGEKGQIFGQINFGYTISSMDNTWVWGAAFGYRHYFNDKVGMNFQATYHYVNDWRFEHNPIYNNHVYSFEFNPRNLWDLRVGVTWKF